MEFLANNDPEGRVLAEDIVGYLFGYFVDRVDAEVRSSENSR